MLVKHISSKHQEYKAGSNESWLKKAVKEGVKRGGRLCTKIFLQIIMKLIFFWHYETSFEDGFVSRNPKQTDFFESRVTSLKDTTSRTCKFWSVYGNKTQDCFVSTSGIWNLCVVRSADKEKNVPMIVTPYKMLFGRLWEICASFCFFSWFIIWTLLKLIAVKKKKRFVLQCSTETKESCKYGMCTYLF